MPLYEYQCKDCGESFEKMMRFTEADLIPLCPQCESPNTRKKISSVASVGSFQEKTKSSTGQNCSSKNGFS